jgi:hypothetical protein
MRLAALLGKRKAHLRQIEKHLGKAVRVFKVLTTTLAALLYSSCEKEESCGRRAREIGRIVANS